MIPPTEVKGRAHTSIVNVVISKKQKEINIQIDKSKIKTTYYKDSGPGGQHKNKTLSGVRLQYDGLTIECCDTRDQRKNKEIAYERLEQKLKERAERNRYQEQLKNIQEQNPDNGKRGDFERNYNFFRNEIKQGNDKYQLSKFLKGDLSDIYKKSMN
jgi:peptide chain release factor 1